MVPIPRRRWLRFDRMSFVRPPCPHWVDHQWRSMLSFYPGWRGVCGELPLVVHSSTGFGILLPTLSRGASTSMGRRLMAHVDGPCSPPASCGRWSGHISVSPLPHTDLVFSFPRLSSSQPQELVGPIRTSNLCQPYSTSWRQLVSTTTPK